MGIRGKTRRRLELAVWLLATAAVVALSVVLYLRGSTALAAFVAALGVPTLALLPPVLAHASRTRRSDQLHLSVLTDPAAHGVGGTYAASASAPSSTLPLGRVTYDVTPGREGIRVAPKWAYLDLLDSGGPMPEVRYSPYPLEWSWPRLTVRLVNDGDRPLHWTSLEVEVREAVDVLRCIPVLAAVTRPSRSILFVNEGWGPADTGSVSAVLRRVGWPNEPGVQVHLDVQNFKGRTLFDLSRDLERYGVDVELLRRLKPSLTSISAEGSMHLVRDTWLSSDELDAMIRQAEEPFVHGVAVSGVVDLASEGGHICARFQVSASVNEGGNGHFTGGPPPEPDLPDIALGASGSSSPHAVRVAVAAGTSNDHVLTLGSDRSTRYTLALRARTDAGVVHLGDRLEVEVLVPRSHREWSAMFPSTLST